MLATAYADGAHEIENGKLKVENGTVANAEPVEKKITCYMDVWKLPLEEQPEAHKKLHEYIMEKNRLEALEHDQRSAGAVANAQTRCPECEQWLSKDGTCSKCRGTGDTDGANPDSASMQAAEIGKGKAAIEKALATRGDVYGAMARSDVGTIDIVWGDDKHGIQHIITRRDDDKDLGLSDIGGKGMARKVAEVAIRGKAVSSPDSDRIVIEDKKFRVVLDKRTHDTGAKNWILSGFEKVPDYHEKRRAALAQKKVGGAR